MDPDPSKRPTTKQIINDVNVTSRMKWRQWQILMKTFLQDKVLTVCNAMFSLMDLVGRNDKKPLAVTPDRSPTAHPFAYARLKQRTPDNTFASSSNNNDDSWNSAGSISSQAPSEVGRLSLPARLRGKLDFSGNSTPVSVRRADVRRRRGVRGSPAQGKDPITRKRAFEADDDESFYQTPPTSPPYLSALTTPMRRSPMRTKRLDFTPRRLLFTDLDESDASPAPATPKRLVKDSPPSALTPKKRRELDTTLTNAEPSRAAPLRRSTRKVHRMPSFSHNAQ
ncbi:hypothetical protein AAVH_10549 [Aphelenchoides avenae]|nr:hypothetical protein AAVH_10549 [Aphelenchus avenae]